jgi:hypothetical protein
LSGMSCQVSSGHRIKKKIVDLHPINTLTKNNNKDWGFD